MKVLLVCLGNICRSPLAHGILEHLANTEALGWEIDSAGTGNWHIGHPPDSRSVAVARKMGVDISGQRARQFEQADFVRFDHILVMDDQNLKNVLALAQTEEEKQKVRLLLGTDFVPDPYFDDALFEPVYRLIEQGCKQYIAEAKSNKG
jgi:protein-tyrosine phosphatase